MKRQSDLLTGSSCWSVRSGCDLAGFRSERDDGTVKAPWDVHQAATWSLCRHKCTDPASTHSAKGARHRARLISVWPSDVQNSVTIQPSWVCRGGSQNSKLWSVCLPVTPENHTSFNTFNNDSKAAQRDSQLTHERRKHSVCVFSKGLRDNG